MKKIIFILLYLILNKFVSGQQIVPLSRQDSADINKFLHASKQQDSLGNLRGASDYLNRSAAIYWEHNHLKDAVKYYKESISRNEKLRNENGLAMINSNLALIYADMGKHEEALEFFHKTLTVRKMNREKFGVISALINISVVLNNLNRYEEATKFLEEALDIAREINNAKQMCSCYGMLSQTYSKAGNSKKSMHYFELYKTFHEMIQGKKVAISEEKAENQRLKTKLAESEKQKKEFELYKKKIELKEKKEELAQSDSANKSLLKHLSRQELEMKMLETKAENERLKAENEKDKRRKTVLLFLVAGVFILIIAFIIYKAYRRKRKDNIELVHKNEEINQQNEEILVQRDILSDAKDKIQIQNNKIKSSINYAKLIQRATLTKKERLTDFVSGAFILFKPRDIVSGDFYWYAKSNDKIIVAAVDCTGHGVPGAFISMVGNQLLNRIVKSGEITSPEKILYEMDKGIKHAFNQYETDNEDGMDMAICTIDKKNKKLFFAGAKNPLLLIADNEFTYQKGNYSSIGGLGLRKREKFFEKYEFNYKNDAVFYIFSDGFQDQFGGVKDKKFSSRKMRNLIFEIHNKPMNEQHEILEKTHKEWKGSGRQVDDILIIGVKI